MLVSYKAKARIFRSLKLLSTSLTPHFMSVYMPAAVAERLALRFVAERLALHEGGSATTHSTKINPVDICITKTAIQLNSTGKQINTEAHRIERLPKLEHTTSIRRECPEKHELLRPPGGRGGSVLDPQI